MVPRPTCGNNTPMQSLSKWGFICHSFQNQFTPCSCSFDTRSVSDCYFAARQAIIDQLLDYVARNSIKREVCRTHSERPDQKYICLQKKKKKSPGLLWGWLSAASETIQHLLHVSFDASLPFCASMCKKRDPYMQQQVLNSHASLLSKMISEQFIYFWICQFVLCVFYFHNMVLVPWSGSSGCNRPSLIVKSNRLVTALRLSLYDR